MRKILLGSTALVAAGLAAGSASAQSTSEPVKMRISGYYIAAAGYIASQSDGQGGGSVAGVPATAAAPRTVFSVSGPGGSDAGFWRREDSFKHDTEVHFLG